MDHWWESLNVKTDNHDVNQDVATTMYIKPRSSHRKHMCMLEAKSFWQMSRVAVWSEAVPRWEAKIL